jgi:transposase
MEKTTAGLLASMTIESPTDGDLFLAFVEQVLAPPLEVGHIVILDNLGAHKVEGVRQLIESRGAQLLYLPPYSPDFNPIEHAWSKLKQLAARHKSPRAGTTRTGDRPSPGHHHPTKRARLLPPLLIRDTVTMKVLLARRSFEFHFG